MLFPREINSKIKREQTSFLFLSHRYKCYYMNYLLSDSFCLLLLYLVFLERTLFQSFFSLVLKFWPNVFQKWSFVSLKISYCSMHPSNLVFVSGNRTHRKLLSPIHLALSSILWNFYKAKKSSRFAIVFYRRAHTLTRLETFSDLELISGLKILPERFLWAIELIKAAN